MVKEWDRAPDFTAPIARPEAAAGRRGEYTGEDVGSFTLSDRLVYGPVVLAFFPGVYSRTCTQELCDVRDWHDTLGDLDAQVYGVSADTPFSQLAFIDEYDLNFPLVSGFNTDVIAAYGVRNDEGQLAGIANRSMFVIDEEQTVTYRWEVHEPLTFPDLDEIEEAVESATG
ncbi:MAG: redoxin domain-containing protein [Halobacteriales archaeon]|nr:redoxin domain-containing protein [Halobacteriales archaeon]